MVLKFCSPPWSDEAGAVLPRHLNSDEGQTTAVEGQRSRTERAWNDLLTATFRAKRSEESCHWEKEFSVYFDDSKPVGLGFQPSSKSNKLSLVPAESYTCVVRDVAPIGLAADYNTRCRAAGDYSRIIVDKLRVRMVNGADVANVGYADVLQM
ncbi:Extracellular matrix protein [Phytophthora megakarya]|uniref:Extracellular matrix protein n=1 Tax=Phytophthora megakarya TaxID=4795 RepID=A0A225WAL7_9STRA|nr:Extracellular matrix protein [Phytophthora megakarya]